MTLGLSLVADCCILRPAAHGEMQLMVNATGFDRACDRLKAVCSGGRSNRLRTIRSSLTKFELGQAHQDLYAAELIGFVMSQHGIDLSTADFEKIKDEALEDHPSYSEARRAPPKICPMRAGDLRSEFAESCLCSIAK
jgi:hypothetical protein